MESLYEAIPMELWPAEYLPDDYNGPSAGPIKDITGRTLCVLRSLKYFGVLEAAALSSTTAPLTTVS